MRHGFQLAGIAPLWLVALNIDWDCLVPHCIMDSRDQWEFPPFFRLKWQSLCSALTAGIKAVQKDCERVLSKPCLSAFFFLWYDHTETQLLSNTVMWLIVSCIFSLHCCFYPHSFWFKYTNSCRGFGFLLLFYPLSSVEYTWGIVVAFSLAWNHIVVGVFCVLNKPKYFYEQYKNVI